MKLMMVCPTRDCLGEVATVEYVECHPYPASEPCPDCKGKCMEEPPQQILDDLESAEIERELIKHDGYFKYYKSMLDGDWRCELYSHAKWQGVVCQGKTKLEALRKAKDWMDGRGAE